jgi:hypothetical protein
MSAARSVVSSGSSPRCRFAHFRTNNLPEPEMQTSSSFDASIGSGQPVKPWIKHAPAIITVGSIVILAVHGRIAQPLHYNEFADQSAAFGIHHAADVFSNTGFALVAALILPDVS